MAARCFRSFATASLRGSDNRSNLAAQRASRNPPPTGAKRRLESQICLRNGTSVSSWHFSDWRVVRAKVGNAVQSGHDTPSHFNPDDEYTARASPPVPRQAVERDRGEQREAGVAVRLEHGKAQRRVGDIEAADLPAEMRGEERDARREHEARSRGKSGKADQQHGRGVEGGKRRFGPLAEQERGRFDADERIIVAV